METCVFVLLIIVAAATGEQCRFISPCTCKTSNYIVNLQISKPWEVRGGDYIYYVDPCRGLKAPRGCVQVSQNLDGCQVANNDQLFFGMGEVSKNNILGDPAEGTVTLKSHYKGNDTDRTMNIVIDCSESAEDTFTYVNVTDPSTPTYFFTAGIKNGCKKISSSDSGLSAGSVLVILFFVFLVVYFVGGVLFLKLVRKAQGAEAIPNVEFWKDFPSLMKDGVMFTCRGCKSESTYEKI